MVTEFSVLVKYNVRPSLNDREDRHTVSEKMLTLGKFMNEIESMSQLQNLAVGRDSVFGIATCYGLDDPAIECRWGRHFPYPSIPAPRPTLPPVQ